MTFLKILSRLFWYLIFFLKIFVLALSYSVIFFCLITLVQAVYEMGFLLSAIVGGFFIGLMYFCVGIFCLTIIMFVLLCVCLCAFRKKAFSILVLACALPMLWLIVANGFTPKIVFFISLLLQLVVAGGFLILGAHLLRLLRIENEKGGVVFQIIDKMKKFKFKWSCLVLIFLAVASVISYFQIRWCYYDSLMRALTVEDIAGVWELDNNNGETKSKITFFSDGRFSYVNIPMGNFLGMREMLESGSGKWTLDNSGEWDPCISIRSDISNTWVLMYMNYDGANENTLRLSVFYDEEKLFFKKLTKDGVD